MEERKGLVFDIQGFSVHDGPGCRTLVFLSGCPLHCPWCANPEGMKKKSRLLFSRQKCRYEKSHCRRCLTACPYGGVRETGNPENPLEFDRKICDSCTIFACAKACAHEAARISGQYRTTEEIMRIFRRTGRTGIPREGLVSPGESRWRSRNFSAPFWRPARRKE